MLVHLVVPLVLVMLTSPDVPEAPEKRKKEKKRSLGEGTLKNEAIHKYLTVTMISQILSHAFEMIMQQSTVSCADAYLKR